MSLSPFEKWIQDVGGAFAALRLWDSIPSDENKRAFQYDWDWFARPEQRMPGGEWDTWLVRAGRGFGKTRTGAETTRLLVEQGRVGRVALVGPTAADVRDVMVEGPAGVLAVSPSRFRPEYQPSKRRVVWPNGAVATLFSAEEPERLRGPQHDFAWCDEAGAWKYPQQTWDMLQFGLRLGIARAVVTTTPRPIQLIKDLIKDPSTVETRGSTYDNVQNLSPKFRHRILRLYEGTRLGRQEIHAEILDDNPAALWRQPMIDASRVERAPQLTRMGVGVDPAVSSDEDSSETGIITAGAGSCRCKGAEELHAFVVADDSGVYPPKQRGDRIVAAYRDNQADRVYGEVNNGGDLVENLIRTAEGGQSIPFEAVHASRGKQMRHDPVASLYERGMVHHVGRFPKLEDQMTQWDPTQAKSPDRVDALTIIVTKLLVQHIAPPGFSDRPKPTLRRRI